VTTTKSRTDSGAGLLAGEERRRSLRVIIRVPVTLEFSKDGEATVLVAYTMAVNVHGAMLVCSKPLNSETKIQITNDRTRERVAGRVTRSPRESAEGFLIPVEFEQPTATFWQISFPPTNWKPADS
jgi:hypothetical protein